jgi:hypothetical protein
LTREQAAILACQEQRRHSSFKPIELSPEEIQRRSRISALPTDSTRTKREIAAAAGSDVKADWVGSDLPPLSFYSTMVK